MKKEPRYHRGSARNDIPEELATRVGKIVINWAYLEHVLQNGIWLLVQVTQPVGRLAIREPRCEDRLLLIRDLATLKQVPLPDTVIDGLFAQVKSMKNNRDLLAHGHWIYDEKDRHWCVVLSRGKWSHDEPHPSSKTIVPEGLIVTPNALDDILKRLDELIKLSLGIVQLIEHQLPPQPEVPPPLLPRRSRKKDLGPSAREPRP